MARLIPAVIVFMIGLGSGTQNAMGQDPLPGRMPGVQLPPRMQQPAGKISVGTWVEYSIRDAQTRRRVRLHYAMVARQGRRVWWEMTFIEARKPATRIKFLAAGPIGKPDRILRIIIQFGGGRALELPLKHGQRLMDIFVRRKSSVPVQDLGQERLTLSAGTFVTRHVRWKDTNGNVSDEWISTNAAIWGLVRFRNNRFNMELLRQGRGARSRIRGVPAKWQIPGF